MKARNLVLLFLVALFPIIAIAQNVNDELIAAHQRVAGQSNAFSASPVAADGRLYFAGEDGDVFVVKAGPTYELLATNPMGEVMMATPAISEGMIIVRTIGHVYGIASASAAKQKAAK